MSLASGAGGGGYRGEFSLVGGIPPSALTGLTPGQIQFGAADGSMTGSADLTFTEASNLLQLSDGELLIDGDLSFPALALHNVDDGSAVLVDLLDDGAGELAAIQFGSVTLGAGAASLVWDGLLEEFILGTGVGTTPLVISAGTEIARFANGMMDMSTDIDMNNNRITGSADAAGPTDLVTLQQLEAVERVQTVFFGASSVGTTQDVKTQFNQNSSTSAGLTPANNTFRRMFFERDATVKNLLVGMGSVSQDYEIMVQKNGVDTSLGVTVASGGTSGSDLVDTVSVTSGDSISVYGVPRNANLISGVIWIQATLEVIYDN